MALTEFQRRVCRLLAERRIAAGESYVAGAAALNELIAAPRISRDLDLFHDTTEALAATWDADRRLLLEQGLAVRVIRERPTFVEAEVEIGNEALLVQWARESAFRFFPLLRHPDLGLTLHPFDLATNKVLALVGRLEVRDWIDAIECHDRIQPVGYLAWAACGKDPGFGPASILEHAARSGRYSEEEVRGLSFEGVPPDAAELAHRWRAILAGARDIVAALPAKEAGRAVLRAGGGFVTAGAAEVGGLLDRGEIVFHAGRIGGAVPEISPRR
jgi:hypothetical protein